VLVVPPAATALENRHPDQAIAETVS
jgi:hypothetical protein